MRPDRNASICYDAELQQAHIENINRLAEEGRLFLAGPFLDADSLQGLYIFNVRTVEEARACSKNATYWQKPRPGLLR